VIATRKRKVKVALRLGIHKSRAVFQHCHPKACFWPKDLPEYFRLLRDVLAFSPTIDEVRQSWLRQELSLKSPDSTFKNEI
jgi:hypothetical protein